MFDLEVLSKEWSRAPSWSVLPLYPALDAPLLLPHGNGIPPSSLWLTWPWKTKLNFRYTVEVLKFIFKYILSKGHHVLNTSKLQHENEQFSFNPSVQFLYPFVSVFDARSGRTAASASASGPGGRAASSFSPPSSASPAATSATSTLSHCRAAGSPSSLVTPRIRFYAVDSAYADCHPKNQFFAVRHLKN